MLQLLILKIPLENQIQMNKLKNYSGLGRAILKY